MKISNGNCIFCLCTNDTRIHMCLTKMICLNDQYSFTLLRFVIFFQIDCQCEMVNFVMCTNDVTCMEKILIFQGSITNVQVFFPVTSPIAWSCSSYFPAPRKSLNVQDRQLHHTIYSVTGNIYTMPLNILKLSL